VGDLLLFAFLIGQEYSLSPIAIEMYGATFTFFKVTNSDLVSIDESER
jgi:hypothetical protein